MYIPTDEYVEKVRIQAKKEVFDECEWFIPDEYMKEFKELKKIHKVI